MSKWVSYPRPPMVSCGASEIYFLLWVRDRFSVVTVKEAKRM